jgi:signal transduction histidine kinase
VAVVTGYDLKPALKRTRIYLMVSSISILFAVLFISTLGTTETSRLFLERLKTRHSVLDRLDRRIGDNNANIRNNLEDSLRENDRLTRVQLIEQVRLITLFNNISLLIFLSIFIWIGLYFVLKPVSISLKEREEFLEYSNHELRTPLAIIHSELELSLLENNFDEVKAVNKNILLEVERLQSLSNTLLSSLSLANNNKQNYKINHEKVIIRDLIDSIWQKLTINNVHNIELVIDESFIDQVNSKENIQKNIQWRIKGKKDHFYHILFNLLDNSLRYCDYLISPRIQLSISQNKLILINKTRETKIINGIGLNLCYKLAHELNLNLQIKVINGDFIVEISNKYNIILM